MRRFCTDCGTAMSFDDAFCPQCGAKADNDASSQTKPHTNQPPPVTQKMSPIFCTDCGTTFAADEAFCSNCGSKAASQVPNRPPQPAIAQLVPPKLPLPNGTPSNFQQELPAQTTAPRKNNNTLGTILGGVFTVAVFLLIAFLRTAVNNHQFSLPASNATPDSQQTGGSGFSSPSGVYNTLLMRGCYVESNTGQRMGWIFDNTGCSFGVNVSFDPNTGVSQGDWLITHAQYNVTGDTVSVSGGQMTDGGKGLAFLLGPQTAGGNVILFTRTNNGQSLQDTSSSGRIIQFIKQ